MIGQNEGSSGRGIFGDSDTSSRGKIAVSGNCSDRSSTRGYTADLTGVINSRDISVAAGPGNTLVRRIGRSEDYFQLGSLTSHDGIRGRRDRDRSRGDRILLGKGVDLIAICVQISKGQLTLGIDRNDKAFALNGSTAAAIFLVAHAAGAAIVELDGCVAAAAAERKSVAGLIDLIIICVGHRMIVSPKEDDLLSSGDSIIQRSDDISRTLSGSSAISMQREVGDDEDRFRSSGILQVGVKSSVHRRGIALTAARGTQAVDEIIASICAFAADDKLLRSCIGNRGDVTRAMLMVTRGIDTLNASVIELRHVGLCECPVIGLTDTGIGHITTECHSSNAAILAVDFLKPGTQTVRGRVVIHVVRVGREAKDCVGRFWNLIGQKLDLFLFCFFDFRFNFLFFRRTAFVFYVYFLVSGDVRFFGFDNFSLGVVSGAVLGRISLGSGLFGCRRFFLLILFVNVLGLDHFLVLVS